MSTRRRTLDDIASSLGLSPNTVSRALRGRDGVSERTRALVMDEAVRVGYLSSAPARDAGVQGIAITVPAATHPFASQLIAAVETGVRAAGYSLELFVTEEDAEQEERIAAHLVTERPAGVIAIPVQGHSRCWARVHSSGIPVVAVSREISETPTDFIGVDSEAGAYAAARHLIGAGARDVLYVDEQMDISTVLRRREGVERAFAGVSGIDVHEHLLPTRRFENIGPQWRAQEAFRFGVAYLRDHGGVDAIVTGDDFFALGIVRALHELRRALPGDVRVTGYGDLDFAEWGVPPLTSVRLPTQLVGELAVATLLKRLAGDTGPRVHRLIRPELIVRDSTRSVRS